MARNVRWQQAQYQQERDMSTAYSNLSKSFLRIGNNAKGMMDDYNSARTAEHEHNKELETQNSIEAQRAGIDYVPSYFVDKKKIMDASDDHAIFLAKLRESKLSSDAKQQSIDFTGATQDGAVDAVNASNQATAKNVGTLSDLAVDKGDAEVDRLNLGNDFTRATQASRVGATNTSNDVTIQYAKPTADQSLQNLRGKGRLTNAKVGLTNAQVGLTNANVGLTNAKAANVGLNGRLSRLNYNLKAQEFNERDKFNNEYDKMVNQSAIPIRTPKEYKKLEAQALKQADKEVKTTFQDEYGQISLVDNKIGGLQKQLQELEAGGNKASKFSRGGTRDSSKAIANMKKKIAFEENKKKKFVDVINTGRVEIEAKYNSKIPSNYNSVTDLIADNPYMSPASKAELTVYALNRQSAQKVSAINADTAVRKASNINQQVINAPATANAKKQRKIVEDSVKKDARVGKSLMGIEKYFKKDGERIPKKLVSELQYALTANKFGGIDGGTLTDVKALIAQAGGDAGGGTDALREFLKKIKSSNRTISSARGN